MNDGNQELTSCMTAAEMELLTGRKREEYELKNVQDDDQIEEKKETADKSDGHVVKKCKKEKKKRTSGDTTEGGGGDGSSRSKKKSKDKKKSKHKKNKDKQHKDKKRKEMENQEQSEHSLNDDNDDDDDNYFYERAAMAEFKAGLAKHEEKIGEEEDPHGNNHHHYHGDDDIVGGHDRHDWLHTSLGSSMCSLESIVLLESSDEIMSRSSSQGEQRKEKKKSKRKKSKKKDSKDGNKSRKSKDKKSSSSSSTTRCRTGDISAITPTKKTNAAVVDLSPKSLYCPRGGGDLDNSTNHSTNRDDDDDMMSFMVEGGHNSSSFRAIPHLDNDNEKSNRSCKTEIKQAAAVVLAKETHAKKTNEIKQSQIVECVKENCAEERKTVEPSFDNNVKVVGEVDEDDPSDRNTQNNQLTNVSTEPSPMLPSAHKVNGDVERQKFDKSKQSVGTQQHLTNQEKYDIEIALVPEFPTAVATTSPEHDNDYCSTDTRTNNSQKESDNGVSLFAGRTAVCEIVPSSMSTTTQPSDPPGVKASENLAYTRNVPDSFPRSNVEDHGGLGDGIGSKGFTYGRPLHSKELSCPRLGDMTDTKKESPNTHNHANEQGQYENSVLLFVKDNIDAREDEHSDIEEGTCSQGRDRTTSPLMATPVDHIIDEAIVVAEHVVVEEERKTIPEGRWQQLCTRKILLILVILLLLVIVIVVALAVPVGRG